LIILIIICKRGGIRGNNISWNPSIVDFIIYCMVWVSNKGKLYQEAGEDCMGLESLLEKEVKMFHPSHYIPTLTR
jgi:hypothetical protein